MVGFMALSKFTYYFDKLGQSAKSLVMPSLLLNWAPVSSIIDFIADLL
jgi:hypothetical protein